jgi:riboflavin biosynthesis pyrimidine reductase
LPPPGVALHYHFNNYVRGFAGPDLAGSLTDPGLIDEYNLYFRPVVLGRGKPYFACARPPLHLVGTDAVGEDAVKLTFVTPQ